MQQYGCLNYMAETDNKRKLSFVYAYYHHTPITTTTTISTINIKNYTNTITTTTTAVLLKDIDRLVLTLNFTKFILCHNFFHIIYLMNWYLCIHLCSDSFTLFQSIFTKIQHCIYCFWKYITAIKDPDFASAYIRVTISLRQDGLMLKKCLNIIVGKVMKS